MGEQRTNGGRCSETLEKPPKANGSLPRLRRIIGLIEPENITITDQGVMYGRLQLEHTQLDGISRIGEAKPWLLTVSQRVFVHFHCLFFFFCYKTHELELPKFAMSLI